MTRKSKRQHSNDDQELQAALQDPNASVHYNHDGSYNIEYKSPEPELERKEHKDYFDTICNIHQQLTEYCSQQGLFLLDCGDGSDFCDLIYQFVPDMCP